MLQRREWGSVLHGALELLMQSAYADLDHCAWLDGEDRVGVPSPMDPDDGACLPKERNGGAQIFVPAVLKQCGGRELMERAAQAS